MTEVKICGMTNLEDAEHAASLGAWAIGLIHHPDSPRFVDPAVAEQIGAALKRRCEVAGVFVNSPIDEVVDAAEREQLTMLQLHGEEGPSFCAEAARRTGAKVMKAFRVRSAADVAGGRGLPHRLPPVRRLPQGRPRRHRRELRLGAGREAPLEGADGAGRRADARERRRGDRSVAHPYAVDVVSGVEAEPGSKDHAKVEAFLEAAAGVEEPGQPE